MRGVDRLETGWLATVSTTPVSAGVVAVLLNVGPWRMHHGSRIYLYKMNWHITIIPLDVNGI